MADSWQPDLTPTWLVGDAAAIDATEGFREIVRSGDPDQIERALGAVWISLDRGALWLSSHRVNWPRTADSLAASTCTVVLPVLAGHLRGVAALGRASLDLLPTAMAAGRAAFELGLRVAWVYSGATTAETELRAAALHRDSSAWRAKVASRLEQIGVDGARWRAAAETQAALVDQRASDATVPVTPNVYDQLLALGLERLYNGFQLASEYAHGGLGSGLELAAIRDELSPFGLYWPQDWYLAVNLCAWGCLFVRHHAGDDEGDPGPVKGVMWASELLLASPGPRR